MRQHRKRRGRSRATIGISIHSDGVRAVGVRRGRHRRVVWSLEYSVAPEMEPLETQLEAVLARIPRKRWAWRPRVVVAVGPSRAQTKLLAELSGLSDSRAVTEVVSQGAAKSFLANGVPLVTSVGRLTSEGGWVAAYDQSVIEAITGACQAGRVRLTGIVPSAFVAPLAIGGTSLVVRDGHVAAEVSAEGGEVSCVNRRLGTVADASATCGSLTDGSPLAALGELALRYVEAYGAAISPAGEWAIAGQTTASRPSKSIPRWRAVAATAAACIGITVGLAAPGLAPLARALVAERELATLATEHSAAADVQRRIDHVTLALDEVARFSEARRSSLALLSALTAALPAETAIVTLRVEGAGGSVVALAPRAAVIVTQLELVEAITAPEIIGPVTREIVAGRELERVTVRFRLQAPRPAES